MIANEHERTSGRAPGPGPGPGPASGPARDRGVGGSASDELGSALDDARAYVSVLLEELAERGRIALAHTQLKLWKGVFGGVVIAVVALALVAASAAGSWMFVRGVRDGLARVVPGWVADLGTGLLMMGCIAGGLWILRARLYRRVLIGLRPPEPSPRTTPEAPAPREERREAPR